MTPEIAALIDALHQPGLNDIERHAIWARFNSVLEKP